MSLLTLDEARQTLQLADNDTDGDDVLQRYLDAITTAVENHVNEVITPREVTERLRLTGRGKFVLTKSPVISLTSLTGIDGTVYPTTGMDVAPSGVVEVFAGAIPNRTVVAVYQAGYETAPANYKEGAAVILQHIWESRRGAGTVIGGVVGPEERLNRTWMYDVTRKALEWLGTPGPGV